MGKPVTTAFISDQVQIPTVKVGCLQVTSQLQVFLDQYPPRSKEKAFEHIYQILQVLEVVQDLQHHGSQNIYIHFLPIHRYKVWLHGKNLLQRCFVTIFV